MADSSFSGMNADLSGVARDAQCRPDGQNARRHAAKSGFARNVGMHVASAGYRDFPFNNLRLVLIATLF